MPSATSYVASGRRCPRRCPRRYRAYWQTGDSNVVTAAALSGALLVITMLAGMVAEGPPVPAPAADPEVQRRCAEHDYAPAAHCSPCWSEVRTGDREPRDVGKLLVSAL